MSKTYSLHSYVTTPLHTLTWLLASGAVACGPVFDDAEGNLGGRPGMLGAQSFPNWPHHHHDHPITDAGSYITDAGAPHGQCPPGEDAGGTNSDAGAAPELDLPGELCTPPSLEGYAYAEAPEFWLGSQEPFLIGVEGQGYLTGAHGKNDAYRLYRETALSVSPEGYVESGSGQRILGYATGGAAGCLSELRLPTFIHAKATTTLTLTMNLDASTEPSFQPFDPETANGGSAASVSMVVLDDAGQSHTLDIYFAKEVKDGEPRLGSNLWSYYLMINSSELEPAGGSAYTLIGSGVLEFEKTGVLKRDSGGDFCVQFVGRSPQCIQTEFGKSLSEGGTGLRGTTQFASPTDASSITRNGHVAGAGTTLQVDLRGRLSVLFDNGQEFAVGQLALARFADEAELELTATEIWRASVASGEPTFSSPGTPGYGYIHQLVPEEYSAAELALGASHSCAILVNGALRCWGSNQHGQLGYAHTENIGDNEHPGTAGDLQLGGAVAQVSAGGEHTCVLLDNGSLNCWGSNQYGQLGYGHTENIGDNEIPSSSGAVELMGKATDISAGGRHTCALIEGGAIQCWGDNTYGQLGYGHTESIGDDESIATAGSVLFEASATEVAAGERHTCARLSTGAVHCWGDNAQGQLGYADPNTIGDDEFPSEAGSIEGLGDPLSLSLGGEFSCAVGGGMSMDCWGRSQHGYLGSQSSEGTAPSFAYPTQLGSPVISMATGSEHACIVQAHGLVQCWGYNGQGQLGYGHTLDVRRIRHSYIQSHVGLNSKARVVAAGGEHSCAILTNGLIRCWGNNSEGQLGYGNTRTIGDNESPAQISYVRLGDEN